MCTTCSLTLGRRRKTLRPGAHTVPRSSTCGHAVRPSGLGCSRRLTGREVEIIRTRSPSSKGDPTRRDRCRLSPSPRVRVDSPIMSNIYRKLAISVSDWASLPRQASDLLWGGSARRTSPLGSPKRISPATSSFSVELPQSVSPGSMQDQVVGPDPEGWRHVLGPGDQVLPKATCALSLGRFRTARGGVCLKFLVSAWSQ